MWWFIYLILKCLLLIPFLIMILHEAQTLLSSLYQFTSVGFLFKSWSWELTTWIWQLWVWVLKSDIAPQYHFCKVVMWPWSDQSQQRMSSRHIVIVYFSDTIPSHQEALKTLRANVEFTKFIVSVAVQKLQQVNERGVCDGAEGQDKAKVFKYCCQITR